MSNIPYYDPINLTSIAHPTNPNQHIIYDTTPDPPLLHLHSTPTHILINNNQLTPLAPLLHTPSDLRRILTAPEYARTSPNTLLQYLNSVGAAINRQEPWIRDAILHFLRTGQLNTAASEVQGMYVLDRQRELLEAAMEHGVERLQQAVLVEARREFGVGALGEVEDDGSDEEEEDDEGDEGDDGNYGGDGGHEIPVTEEGEPEEEAQVEEQEMLVDEPGSDQAWDGGEAAPGDEDSSDRSDSSDSSDNGAAPPAETSTDARAETPPRSIRVLRSSMRAGRDTREDPTPSPAVSQAGSGDDEPTGEEELEGVEEGDKTQARRSRKRRGDDKVDEPPAKRRRPFGDDDDRWEYAPGKYVHPVHRGRFSRDGTTVL